MTLKEIWMCENEQARWFEFEQPHDLPNDVTITKMVPHRTAEQSSRTLAWVGLTGVEIRDAWHKAAERYNNLMSHEFYKEIESKLKEKNT